MIKLGISGKALFAKLNFSSNNNSNALSFSASWGDSF
jgi:hypothetical protein